MAKIVTLKDNDDKQVVYPISSTTAIYRPDGVTTIEAILDNLYPIGSVYITTNNVSPASLFGGTWEQILGRFLLATGTPSANSDNYFGEMSEKQWSSGLGSTGGQDYHTLVEKELPYIDGEIATAVISAHHSNGTTGHAYGTKFPNVTNGIIGTQTSNPDPQWGYGYKFGNNGPHNNMPPYLAVNMWKRTA